MSRNQISVPIVKNGKDICRLVFTKADNGRYDIKINFLGNAFQVQSYRLFSHRPIIWDVSNPQNSMSYHYGRDNHPVVIHIKKERPDPGELSYSTLPTTRIQPPNINQMFPLPLLKIEIPDTVVAGAKEYQAKPKHKTIDLGNSNVLELFMMPDGFLNQNFMKKYSIISTVYMMISVEFFASNTVLSDYQKRPNVISHGEPADRGIGILGLHGMELYASVFPDYRVDAREKLMMTFIENELTEPILLSGIVRYPENGSGIFFGGANYEQVDFPAPLMHICPVTDSVAERTLAFDHLSAKERVEISQRAVAGRIRLRDEMKRHRSEIREEEGRLNNAAAAFMDCLHRLQEACLTMHQPHSGEDGYHVTDEDIWLMTDFFHHSADVHLLFAKYMGNDHCTFIRRSIQSKNYSAPAPHEKQYDSKGHEIVVFRSCSIHEMVFQHTWLAYDDRFDVDLLRGSLNLFLGKNEEKEPAYSIAKALLTSNNDSWGGMKDKLFEYGFICGPVQVLNTDNKVIDELMSANNNLLKRVLKRITKAMESE